MGRLARGLVMAGLAVMLAGCGTLPRHPVPPELTPVASIPGMPEMRAWAGRPSAAMERDFERSFQQESPTDFPRGAAREDIFVIHNGKLSEAPSPTPRSLRGIAALVIEASVRAGVVNDLIRIYAFAQRDQASFHWVTIDESVDLQGAEVFDPVKMGELYAIGDRTARAGPEWEVRPPGFQDVQPPP